MTRSESAPFHARQSRLAARVRGISRPLSPIGLPIAGRRWLPLYAILRHTGRVSGRRYATPVVGLRTSGGFLIPLPFGDTTQWARNLFAAGGGELRQAGADHRIDGPRVVEVDEVATDLPGWVRTIAPRLGIRQFVAVRVVPDGTSQT